MEPGICVSLPHAARNLHCCAVLCCATVRSALATPRQFRNHRNAIRVQSFICRLAGTIFHFFFICLASHWSPAKRQILKQQARLAGTKRRRRRRRRTLDGLYSQDNRLPDRGANVIRQIQFTAICMPHSQTRSWKMTIAAVAATAMLQLAGVILMWRNGQGCACSRLGFPTIYTLFLSSWLPGSWLLHIWRLIDALASLAISHQQPATSHLQQQLQQRFFFLAFLGEQGQPAAGSSFVSAIAGNEKLPNMPRSALHRHAYVAHNWRLCHKRRNATCTNNSNRNNTNSNGNSSI